MLITPAYAQAAGGGDATSFITSLVPLILIFVIFYFLLIRPQRKRREQQTQLQSGLAVGDEVVTIGGLYGTVAELDDQTVILESSEGVYARYARGAISQKVSSAAEEDGGAEAEADAEAETPSGSGSFAEPRDSKD